MNGMHDRVVMRPVAVGEMAGEVRGAAMANGQDGRIANSKLNERCVTLDEEFPIDMPIKLLKIDVQDDAAAILRGARRLSERRCIDFIVIKVLREVLGSRWRRELGGARWRELLTQLNRLTEANYVACTPTGEGSLVEHENPATALEKLEGRNIVLMARDQYTAGDLTA